MQSQLQGKALLQRRAGVRTCISRRRMAIAAKAAAGEHLQRQSTNVKRHQASCTGAAKAMEHPSSGLTLSAGPCPAGAKAAPPSDAVVETLRKAKVGTWKEVLQPMHLQPAGAQGIFSRAAYP